MEFVFLIWRERCIDFKRNFTDGNFGVRKIPTRKIPTSQTPPGEFPSGIFSTMFLDTPTWVFFNFLFLTFFFELLSSLSLKLLKILFCNSVLKVLSEIKKLIYQK